jgi:hypothetical protein
MGEKSLAAFGIAVAVAASAFHASALTTRIVAAAVNVIDSFRIASSCFRVCVPNLGHPYLMSFVRKFGWIEFSASAGFFFSDDGPPVLAI